MKKPIIGIVGRSYLLENQPVIQLNEEYRIAIVKAGGIPIEIIPNDTFYYGISQSNIGHHLTDDEKNDLSLILEKCDGILMPGGYCWYDFDEYICAYALKNNIPILGICLGMQILGSIDVFDIDGNHDFTVKNDTNINHCQIDKKYVHDCFIMPGILYQILNTDKITVNSRHNYHITPKPYFHIEAYSEDGLIEAISIPNCKFALGVQWHPESMINYDYSMSKIFEAFVIASKSK